MKLPSLYVDTNGDTYFEDIDAEDAKGKPREQDIAYWQMWELLSGHYRDFKSTEEPCCVGVLAGKVEIVTSLGVRRYFSRGDTFLLQDLSGKGHTIRAYGAEPFRAIRMTMKKAMAAKA